MAHLNNFPKLHNAAWPGVVGKGPGSEPPIDLDTMLDLTAAAEVDGVKFDGFDLFLFDPHVNIDSSDDDLKRLADKAGQRNLVIGSVVAPVWPPTGGGSAMGSDEEERKQFLEQVRKGCRIAQRLRELGIRPYGVVRIDSATGVSQWAEGDRDANTKRIAETFTEACNIAEDFGERLAAEGEICWGGMHSWRRMLQLLEMVDRPQDARLPGRHGPHAALHAGLQRPGRRDPAAGFRLEGHGQARRRAQAAHRRPAALDDRLSRRPERRHRPRHRLARQDGPPLPAQRPQRQARHRQGRRLLAPRRQGQPHQKVPPHLLGRLHVPQQDDDGPQDVEKHSRRDGCRARRAWLVKNDRGQGTEPTR